jgi:hypothetical protein
VSIESYVKKRKREKDEVMLGRSALRDKRLSLQAKGLLGVLMAMEDDEIMTMEFVRTLSDCGETRHRSAMQMLEIYGYVMKRRLTKENGQFCGWEYIVDDVEWIPEENRKIHKNKPKRENQVTDENTETGKSSLGPKRENPVVENQFYKQRDFKRDLKEIDMIDRVYEKLVKEFPNLKKEDCTIKYNYCVQYNPANMEIYLEKALRKDLSNAKRKTRKATRTELLPSWFEEENKKTATAKKEDTPEQKAKRKADVMEKINAFRNA